MSCTAVVRKMEIGWMALAASERGLATLTLPRKSRKIAEIVMRKRLKSEKIEMITDQHHILEIGRAHV